MWHRSKIPTIFLCPPLMLEQFFQRNPQDLALQCCQPGVSSPGFYSSYMKRSIYQLVLKPHFAFKSEIIGLKTMLLYALKKNNPNNQVKMILHGGLSDCGNLLLDGTSPNTIVMIWAVLGAFQAFICIDMIKHPVQNGCFKLNKTNTGIHPGRIQNCVWSFVPPF